MSVTAKTLHGARVCLLPRPENNYRPLVLRKRALMAVSGLILAAKCAALALVLVLPTSAELSTITNARILQLTNEERVQNGLAALTLNGSLAQAAAEKAQDMIDIDYFAHISPTGVTPWFWIQKNNYVYTVAGENLAIDFVQAEDVVDAWMASPSHRDNILQPDYAETGIAVLTGEYQGGTSTVVVHMFGLASGAARPSQSSSLSARSPVTAETTPVPKPVISPIPTTAPEPVAPAIPVIEALDSKETVRETIRIQATAEPGATVHVQINGKEAAATAVGNLGYVQQVIDLKAMADGQLAITAWAQNEAGLTSQTTAPLMINKDTVGPDIERNNLVFIISPATDAPVAMLEVPAGEFNKLTVEADNQRIVETALPGKDKIIFPLINGTVKVFVFDAAGNASIAGIVDLQPAIFTDRGTELYSAPARINTIARRLIIAIALLIIVLLLLAVMIKIRIQHPRMIAHASLVILLAVILLMI